MLPWIQSTVFFVAYAALTWVVIWFNTAILGRGDVKFGGGYGGQELYFPLWLAFFAPAALLAVGSIFQLDAVPTISWAFTLTLLIVLMVSLSACFFFDIHWIVLLTFTILYGVGVFWAARVASRIDT